MGCLFTSDDPYMFGLHKVTPHTWPLGSDMANWARAKAEGHRVKHGLLVSGPTNMVCTSRPPTQSISPTSSMSPSPTLTSPTSLTSSNSLPTPKKILSMDISYNRPTVPKKPKLGKKLWLKDNMEVSSTSEPFYPTIISNGKWDLFKPVSYYMWKRQLPPPAPIPHYGQWTAPPSFSTSKVYPKDLCLPTKVSFCWGVNCSNTYSSHPCSPLDGSGVPIFKEDGNWSHYSTLFLPKKTWLSGPSDRFPSVAPTKKRRVPRPKAGSNTQSKAHGLSRDDRLLGGGKTIPIEDRCEKKSSSK